MIEQEQALEVCLFFFFMSLIVFTITARVYYHPDRESIAAHKSLLDRILLICGTIGIISAAASFYLIHF